MVGIFEVVSLFVRIRGVFFALINDLGPGVFAVILPPADMLRFPRAFGRGPKTLLFADCLELERERVRARD